MAVSITDAGDANGRVEGCCWVATVAVVAMDVLFEEIDKAPLHRAAAQSVATLDGFLGWSLSAVLCVMLAVALRRGVHRRGGPLAVVRLHGSLVLDIIADVRFSMFELKYVD